MRLVYRELGQYKYLLLEPFEVEIDEDLYVDHEYIHCEEGIFIVKSGYAWDGPSGPALDTEDTMKASLIHDAFYQLMRIGYLNYKVWKPFADKLLYQMCIEAGMPKWRATYFYLAVKCFGPKYKKAKDEPNFKKVVIE